MYVMKKLKFLILLLGFIAAAQNASWAGTTTSPAVTITGGSFLGPNAGTYGWAFTVSGPVIVTDLGYFDLGGNGLAAAHPVAIWTSAGVLVQSATVPSGTNASEFNSFLYTPVAPTFLPPGSYVIGGFDGGSSGDIVIVGASTITPAAGIAYNGSRSVAGAALTFPPSDAVSNGSSYFGPNFLFTVPEPTSNALLLFGGATASVLAWRRRHGRSA
jgi:hypothetical protein